MHFDKAIKKILRIFSRIIIASHSPTGIYEFLIRFFVRLMKLSIITTVHFDKAINIFSRIPSIAILTVGCMAWWWHILFFHGDFRVSLY